MKALTGIILILASVGLFFFQINPNYTEIKDLRAQSGQYDHALDVADELKKIRGELATKLSSFTPEELASLEHFMPQQLDTVRIILDVDGIASAHNIQLKDIKTSDVGKVATAPNQTQSPYNTTSISFAFKTQYNNAEVFIRDIEESLRLFDVASVSIKPSGGPTTGTYDFGLTLNTYWIGKK